MKKVDIRGIPFDNVTLAEAVELIADRVEKKEKTSVFTPNAEMLDRAFRDGEFFEVLRCADVILPDGIGVIKAAEMLGDPLREKVPGVEVGEALFERLSSHRFFFFGGKPEEEGNPSAADAAAKAVTEKYGASVVGCRHGYYEKTGAENDATLRAIEASNADVLYVCLGSPTQELWIAENASKLPQVTLLIALGGSLDVYGGNVARAPVFFIDHGIEWLWRLLRQPSRFFRMLALPRFYFGMKRYARRKKRDERKNGAR